MWQRIHASWYDWHLSLSLTSKALHRNHYREQKLHCVSSAGSRIILPPKLNLTLEPVIANLFQLAQVIVSSSEWSVAIATACLLKSKPYILRLEPRCAKLHIMRDSRFICHYVLDRSAPNCPQLDDKLQNIRIIMTPVDLFPSIGTKIWSQGFVPASYYTCLYTIKTVDVISDLVKWVKRRWKILLTFFFSLGLFCTWEKKNLLLWRQRLGFSKKKRLGFSQQYETPTILTERERERGPNSPFPLPFSTFALFSKLYETLTQKLLVDQFHTHESTETWISSKDSLSKVFLVTWRVSFCLIYLKREKK